ncbi:MAG: glycosyltransferase, partial [Actinomycetota bacterium]
MNPDPARPRVVMFLAEATFSHDWARAARTVADVVTVAVVRDPVSARDPWEERHGQPAVDHWVRAVRRRPGRLFFKLNAEATARRVETTLRDIERETGRRTDVLHGHFYAGSAFLPAVRRRTGIPYVVTEHSTRLTGESAPHKPLTRAGLRIASEVFGAAGRVIAVSEYLRSCIGKLGLAGEVEVIGNPIDIRMFHAPETAPTAP